MFPQRSSFLVLALFLGTVAVSSAQDITEVTLKGAFLFNFARFTDWPADALPPEATLSACVLADRAVGDALTRTVRGKQVGRRPVAVTVVAPTGPMPRCHLLYLSNVPSTRVTEIVSALRDEPILTVSDADLFTKRGGIVQLFVESGKMRFRINTRAAKRARLQLSSRFLALAASVDDDAQPIAFALPLTDELYRWGRNSHD